MTLKTIAVLCNVCGIILLEAIYCSYQLHNRVSANTQCWANDKWSENTLFLHILGCVVFISTYVRTFKN